MKTLEAPIAWSIVEVDHRGCYNHVYKTGFNLDFITDHSSPTSAASSQSEIDRSCIEKLRIRSLCRRNYRVAAWKPQSAKMEMNPANAFESCPAPSKLVSAAISAIAVEGTSHQTLTITIPEPPVCRICKSDDEDDNEEGLVELGCRCKGELSRMHRTCFLQWFGMRMLLRDNFECEVCNSILAFQTQMVVADAVADHENGGREILLKRLKSELHGQRAFTSIMSVDWAADYDELLQVVKVLMASTALSLRETAIDMEMRVFRETAIEMEMQEQDRHRRFLRIVGISVVVWFFIVGILAGVILIRGRG